MTVLIGSSMLLIVASAIALVFGWASANESLIWTSIVSSVLAAIALALAFLRSRVEAAAVMRRTSGREAAPSKEVPPTTEPPTTEPASAEPASAEPVATDQEAQQEVVGIRDTKRFHRPNCRYASSKGAAAMSIGEARKAGMRPCGICKP
jgi:hypothetical protein